MRALVYANGCLQLTTRPQPQPRSGETLIKVALAGICGTDLELFKGYKQFTGIPGHEFVGTVVSSSKYATGCRVVGEINIGCGYCTLCRHNRKTHCSQRRVLGILKQDGAFAEYLVLPDENLFTVADNITDQQAVLVEPLAAAFRIFEQVNIVDGKTIAIVGDGKLGLLVATVLQAKRVVFTLFGHHPAKLDNIDSIYCNKETQITQQHQSTYDYVVEATGRCQGIADAIRLVKAEGSIILKTTLATDPTINLSAIVVNEIQLIGSRCGPFQPALQALAAGKIGVDKLITAVYPLSKWEEALTHANQNQSLKILLAPGQ